jgi:hypothetical protein
LSPSCAGWDNTSYRFVDPVSLAQFAGSWVKVVAVALPANEMPEQQSDATVASFFVATTNAMD